MTDHYGNRRRIIRDNEYTMSLAFGFIGGAMGLTIGMIVLIIAPNTHPAIIGAIMLVAPTAMMALGMKIAWMIGDKKIAALDQEEDERWDQFLDNQISGMERERRQREMLREIRAVAENHNAERDPKD